MYVTACLRPKGILRFVGVVLFLIGGFYLEEAARGYLAWRHYETEAKRRGAKIALADFVLPPVPDDENFASIPILQAGYRAPKSILVIGDPFTRWKRSSVPEPELSDPLKQTPIDLRAWQAYFVKLKLLPAASSNASVDVLQALEHYAEPLAQFSAAGARPHYRPPIHWLDTDTYDIPGYFFLRSAAKLYAVRLSARLAHGESAAAYQDFHDGLHLAEVTIEEPSFSLGLQRQKIAEMMEAAVWSGLAAHQWAEPELRKIDSDLATLDLLKEFSRIVQYDRAEFNLEMDRNIARPERMVDWVFAHALDEVPSMGEKFLCALYPTGWIYQSKVRGNQYADEVAARIDPGQRRWWGSRPIRSMPTDEDSILETTYYATFRLIYGLHWEEVDFVQTATTTDEARMACALERFHLARGAYPATLSELTPEFIPSVPSQIVDGKPYHYRLSDDGGFLLYSVGLDGVDHGGELPPIRPIGERLDWIWRYPAK